MIHKESSREAGSCNFCDRYTNEHGGVEHDVLTINGRGMSCRACLPCARRLAAALTDAAGCDADARQP